MNTQRMNELLSQSGLDAIVALSISNVAYLSGAWIITQQVIPDRLAIVLWPRMGNRSLLSPALKRRLSGAFAQSRTFAPTLSSGLPRCKCWPMR